MAPTPFPVRRILRPLVSLAVLGGTACVATAAADTALEVTVVAQTASTYKRQKLPDGTFKPEGYAFTNGGVIPGTLRDASMEKVPFPAIAEIVARHLAKQQYFLAEKMGEFDLLIVLHWGMTSGYDDIRNGQAIERSGQSMGTLRLNTEKLEKLKTDIAVATAAEDVEGMRAAIEIAEKEKQRSIDSLESSVTMTNFANQERDSANLDNAKVLGYLDAINARRNVLIPGISSAGNDLLRDVEEKRYFVILTAYDFRTVRDKKKQPLWVTRISIRAAGNRFDERMAQMVAAAAKDLGKKTELSRRYYGDPRVELGEIEYLGVVATPTPEAKGKPGK